jgi:hypothetical protein
LELGAEGYSPLVLAQAVRQASKAASFADASDDLRELMHVEISPTHLQRVSERIGAERSGPNRAIATWRSFASGNWSGRIKSRPLARQP